MPPSDSISDSLDTPGGGTPATPAAVVGVGASAGGLEALIALFEAMPALTGLAFVVAQHLSPDHRSLMPELLARKTRVRVLAVEQGMVIEPDTVYLLPPR